ncbi:MAG: cob(I)yrinic acid a,c-diamide adenosyltransferase [Pseudomonadota bacterium]
MGNRLSKIYTCTGDAGETGLGDGSRVAKDDDRVEAYGTVDEANSAIGMVLSYQIDNTVIVNCLTDVQHDLFDVGAELCIPGHKVITAEYVSRLERQLDKFNDELPPLKEFILPGGNPQAAACHLARTICRRAERRVQTLSRDAEINAEALRYLNRLSDLLFVIARVLARTGGGEEVLWHSDRVRGAEAPAE